MDNQIENNNSNDFEIRPKKEERVGPVIGSVIIILLILIGGLYYLDSLRDKVSDKEMQTEETSEGISSLESDLESLNLDEIDSDLNEIEEEIDAVTQ